MNRIVVSAVGKRYQPYPHRLADLLRLAVSGGWHDRPSTWALREVSFAVNDGESVAIIGMNGAGKSTLLRILTGTTQPTDGSVTISGQVAALLELGLGMHADFTGWQNATLACELMGLEPALIRERLPWIQRFAELGDYMHQPVRTYSAGMQLRLAFSAATVVRPDVLIVDEVLAVGDAYFQHKCVERIRSFQTAGTTSVLVTHDLAAVNVHQHMQTPTVGFLIRDRLGADIFGTHSANLSAPHPVFEAGAIVIATFELTLNLGAGSYSITAAVHRGTSHLEASFDWWDHLFAYPSARIKCQPGIRFELFDRNPCCPSPPWSSPSLGGWFSSARGEPPPLAELLTEEGLVMGATTIACWRARPERTR